MNILLISNRNVLYFKSNILQPRSSREGRQQSPTVRLRNFNSFAKAEIPSIGSSVANQLIKPVDPGRFFISVWFVLFFLLDFRMISPLSESWEENKDGVCYVQYLHRFVSSVLFFLGWGWFVAYLESSKDSRILICPRNVSHNFPGGPCRM